MELMGTVTAISHSVAYFIQISKQSEEIYRKLVIKTGSLKTGLSIPSVLRVLLDKAFALHSQYQTRQQAQEALSEIFTANFLSRLPRSVSGGSKLEMALRELLMSRDSNAARSPQMQAVLKPLILRHTVTQWDEIIENFDAWGGLQGNALGVERVYLPPWRTLEGREVYSTIVDAYRKSTANFKQDIFSITETAEALEIMPTRGKKSRPDPGRSSHAGMSEEIKAGSGPDPEVDPGLPATAPKKLEKKLSSSKMRTCCGCFWLSRYLSWL